MTPGKYWGLKRLADDAGRFKMLAVDQRPPIKNLVRERRGEDEARAEDVRAVKRLLMETLSPYATAVLADPTHALADALTILRPEHGLIATMEDSLFAGAAGGRTSREIDGWSVAKCRRIGADAVKVLVWFRPDQSAGTAAAQRDFARRVGDACAAHDVPYLFELLVYPLGGEAGTTDYAEQPAKRSEHVLASVEEFAKPDYGVDLFKLESPVPAAEVPEPGDAGCAGLYAELGRLAGRPWVMLSAGASKDAFRRVLSYAYAAGASGYLAGRAIWWDDFQAFPDLHAIREGLGANGAPYMAELNALTDAEARPWPELVGDPGGAWPKLPHAYPEPGA